MQFDGGKVEYFRSSVKSHCKSLSSPFLKLAMVFLLFGCSGLYESEMLNQFVHESRAVRRCYRAVRDLRIISFSECSSYARSHLFVFGISEESRAATGACIASLALAIYEQTDELSGQTYTLKQQLDIASDCERRDIEKHTVRDFMLEHIYIEPSRLV